jgi:hypothetical protein
MLSIELQTPASTVVIPVIRAVAADLAARADWGCCVARSRSSRDR